MYNDDDYHSKVTLFHTSGKIIDYAAGTSELRCKKCEQFDIMIHYLIQFTFL